MLIIFQTSIVMPQNEANPVIDAIHKRRSVREFEERGVPDEIIEKIIEAGTWAPSGLNNQPWRFAIVKDAGKKEELSKLTHYGHIINGAPACIAVFLDEEASYDRTKDVMAIGACNQNILLAAHSLGLGAVWLGEILKMKEEARELLGVPETCELMAVIALGYPAPKKRKSSRKEASEVTFNYP
jgi:nitroreductase